MCSVFSVEGLKIIDPLVKRHKVPSGRINDATLLHAVAACGKPVILSTGLATYREATTAAQRLTSRGLRVAVLECTSLYPCPAEKVNLRGAVAWGGLSDHSGSIHAGIAAAAVGCEVLEVHVCWSKEQGTLDARASLTLDELGQLVKGVRFVEKALTVKDKDEQAQALGEMRRVFMGAA
jgi:N-acetylneuraminate synthase